MEVVAFYSSCSQTHVFFSGFLFYLSPPFFLRDFFVSRAFPFGSHSMCDKTVFSFFLMYVYLCIQATVRVYVVRR